MKKSSSRFKNMKGNVIKFSTKTGDEWNEYKTVAEPNKTDFNKQEERILVNGSQKPLNNSKLLKNYDNKLNLFIKTNSLGKENINPDEDLLELKTNNKAFSAKSLQNNINSGNDFAEKENINNYFHYEKLPGKSNESTYCKKVNENFKSIKSGSNFLNSDQSIKPYLIPQKKPRMICEMYPNFQQNRFVDSNQSRSHNHSKQKDPISLNVSLNEAEEDLIEGNIQNNFTLVETNCKETNVNSFLKKNTDLCVFSDDNSSSESSDISDTIEEAILRQKLHNVNGVSQKNLDENAINEMYSSNLATEKEILSNYLSMINEALQINIQLRNQLFDIEYIIINLNILSVQSSSLKMSKVTFRKNSETKFYQKFLAPYFKSKRSVSFAPHLDEGIVYFDDYLGLSGSTHPDIYEVYKAIRDTVLESNNSNSVDKPEPVEPQSKGRGRKKMYHESDYGESHLCSMESQFLNFLDKYSKLNEKDDAISEDRINWYKVTAKPNLRGMKVEECIKMWRLVLKPLLHLGPWREAEQKKVLKLAKEHNFQNWDIIAQELGTGRSGYLCFCFVMHQAIPGITQNKGFWSQEEDDFLLSLVNKCSLGNTIVWGQIFYYFEDRTVSQVLNRWYRLNPALKRGYFSQKEDTMLMYCVDQFGKDFGKVASIFENRNPIQLRERFFSIKHLLERSKKHGAWTLEEDRTLLNLVREHGESNWAKIETFLPGRNRIQIRHRYREVLKDRIANPKFRLESLKRHKRINHEKSKSRLKLLDDGLDSVKTLVEHKLKKGKATLKRDKHIK